MMPRTRPWDRAHNGNVNSVEVISAREVPLGGVRGMPVKRTIPHKKRSFIGAWCFADHYGPNDVSHTGGMHVAPHPHTGLQTVTWLFTGEIEHRDSLGTLAYVRPGQLNLMTAGAGIAHSEVSTKSTTLLHGVQLWVALPEESRGAAPNFEHYEPGVVSLPGGELRVFLGTLAGDTSPVETFTPLLGAELTIAPESTIALRVDPEFEHGVLVDHGAVTVQGTPVNRYELAYVSPGHRHLTIATGGPARVLILGGTPFGEKIIMWWNFVGRSTEEIHAYRKQWHAEIGDGTFDGDRQFGPVVGYVGRSIPAPALPTTPLLPRG
ncbi:MAG: pirin family protein [Nocardiaceae bacterium]|nr:pirin family protein [Nocardiaceae bacterium]